MLQSNAKPAFLAACACHAVIALIGGVTIENYYGVTDLFVLVVGALAFIAAAALGIRLLLNDDEGIHRRWIKAALVFLTLGPVAYWFLQAPAISGMICIDTCYSAAFEVRARADIIQSQVAMIGVGFAALFCATKATTAPLEELAV